MAEGVSAWRGERGWGHSGETTGGAAAGEPAAGRGGRLCCSQDDTNRDIKSSREDGDRDQTKTFGFETRTRPGLYMSEAPRVPDRDQAK